LRADPVTANLLIAGALLIGVPLIVMVGRLADRIGRKPIMLTCFLLSALCYFPLFQALTEHANPALAQAQRTAPVTVIADPAACSFQFNPVGTSAFTQSCDIAKSFLAKASVTYKNEAAPAGTTASVRIGDTVITSFEGKGLPPAELKAKSAEFSQAMSKVIKSLGYPVPADNGQCDQ